MTHEITTPIRLQRRAANRYLAGACTIFACVAIGEGLFSVFNAGKAPPFVVAVLATFNLALAAACAWGAWRAWNFGVCVTASQVVVHSTYSTRSIETTDIIGVGADGRRILLELRDGSEMSAPLSPPLYAGLDRIEHDRLEVVNALVAVGWKPEGQP